MRRVSSFSALLFSLSVATIANADWTSVHRDGTNNAVVPISATVTSVAGAPAWTTGAGDLYAGPRPLVYNGGVYAFSTSGAPAKFHVKAFRDVDGAALWTSEALDTGDSITNLSASGLLIDPAGNTLFAATGSSVEKLDLADEGAILWTKTMDATNTDPEGATGIVNSSPSLGGGFVYIKTTNFAAGASQVVAINAGSGAIEWFKKTGGPGANSPLYIDVDGTPMVVVDSVDAEGSQGLTAFNAATGAEVWNHSTVEEPWSVGSGFAGVWADLVYIDGKIYGFSYDFSATGKLIVVDPATGAAELHDSLGTDCPPLILGDNLFGIGGGFGDADFNAYNAATGEQAFTSDLRGGNESIFRNYMAATNDLIYTATGSDTSYLLILDPTDGSVISRSKTGSGYTGAVTLDDDGNLYVVGRNGSLNAFGTFAAPQPEQPDALHHLTAEYWANGATVEPFSAPIYTTTEGLGIAVDDNPANTFGFWQTDVLEPLPAGKYELSVTILPIEGEEGTRLPETRVRVLRGDNTMSNQSVIADTGSNRPYDEAAKVLWESDGVTPWRIAVDLLSFEADIDGGFVITAMENRKVE